MRSTANLRISAVVNKQINVAFLKLSCVGEAVFENVECRDAVSKSAKVVDGETQKPLSQLQVR